MEETTGIFLGSEWKGKGVSNAGKNWEKYALKFKPNMQSDKSFSIGVFIPLPFKASLQLNELKPGTEYKILYDEKDYTNKQGQPAKSRNACGIYVPSGSEPKAEFKSASTMPNNAISKLDLGLFEGFKVKYLSLLKEKGMTPNSIHMLGSWIASNEKDKYAELIAKCKEAIK